jgi:phospholipid transport system transporter-binding protein
MSAQVMIRNQDASGVTYDISGELDMQTVPGLLQAVEGILSQAEGDLYFDLQGVTRSDSAGLALLVEWLQRAGQAQRRIAFRNLPAQMLTISRVSGLERLLPLQ